MDLPSKAVPCKWNYSCNVGPRYLANLKWPGCVVLSSVTGWVSVSVLSSGSILGSNPTKTFGSSVERWCTLTKKKGICPTSICSSSSEFSDDVITIPHIMEPRTCMKPPQDAAFPGYQRKMNWTATLVYNYCWSPIKWWELSHSVKRRSDCFIAR